MSYPKQTFRLRPSKGCAFDIPANEVSEDFYTGGSNVLFRDGFAQRDGGARPVYTQNDVNPVFHVLNVRAPGGITESNFWLVFGTASIKALETSNKTTITGSALSSVTSPWQWASTLLNNIPCFTNGLDAPRYWGGDVGTPAADLPGWPAGTICKSLVAFKFHLFALDIDGPSGHFESQFLWSDAAAPGNVPSTWTAAATNEAGDDIAADTPSPCHCAVPLQDTLLIFKRSSTYAVNFIGGNDVFQLKLLDGVRGALTRHSACDAGGKAFVVADGDIFLTDGVNWQSVAIARVRDYLFAQLDQASYENLHVVFNRATSEVHVRYPTTGSTYCNEELIYNVSADTWSTPHPLTASTFAAVGVVNDTSPNETWNADSDPWDSDLSAWNSANFSLATEQYVTVANSATLTLEDSEDSVSIDATLYRHDLAFGDPERLKFVKRVHLRTDATPGTLYVRVGSRMSVTDSIAWGAEQALTPPAAYVNAAAMGRFISIEVRSEDEDIWLLTGIDFEFEVRGYH